MVTRVSARERERATFLLVGPDFNSFHSFHFFHSTSQKGAVALGSALENDMVLWTPTHHKKGHATSNQSRMSDRRRGNSNSNSKSKNNETKRSSSTKHPPRRVTHVLRSLLLSENPFGQNGGEALLDACRRCVSIHSLGGKLVIPWFYFSEDF